MSRLTAQGLWVLILVGTLCVGMASSGKMIGVAIAKGSFQVDDARVSGNGTIFDGASVQTAESSSQINLQNGARMALGPDSRARIMAARLTLEKGLGEAFTPEVKSAWVSVYTLLAGTMKSGAMEQAA